MTSIYYKEYTTRENPAQTVEIANFEWINNAKEDYDTMVRHFESEAEFWQKKGFASNGFQVMMREDPDDAAKHIPNQRCLVTESWDDAAECWVRNTKIIRLVEE